MSLGPRLSSLFLALSITVEYLSAVTELEIRRCKTPVKPQLV